MRDTFRAFFKAGIGSTANMAVSLARTKILAFYLGPQGMGLVSLLQQFQATLQPIVTLGGDAPLVQGLASRAGSERSAFLASAFIGLLSSWGVCLIAILLGGDWIGSLLLSPAENFNTQMISFMAIPLIAMAISSFLMALLTTVGAVGSLQKGQLAGSIGGLLAAIPVGLTWKLGNLSGLIFYLTATPLISILAALWYIRRISTASELLANLRLSLFKFNHLRRFLAFGGVTVVTGIATTGSWLLIRREVAHSAGLETLGYFSATVVLSGLALSILLTSLFSFYLPRFTAADPIERKKLLKSVLFIVTPIAACVFLVLQLSPSFIIKLLFTEKFLPMLPLLQIWAAGDFVRTIAVVFGIPIFAGAHLRFLFFSEMIFSGLLLTLILFQLKHNGNIIRVGEIYFLVYTIYLFVVALFCKAKNYI